MSVLGKLTDIQTHTRAGDDLTGLTFQTLNHSLPATNPEEIRLHLQSVQAVGHNPPRTLLAFGGNASMLTIGHLQASTGSAPTVAYQVAAQVFYSTIR